MKNIRYIMRYKYMKKKNVNKIRKRQASESICPKYM